MMMKMYLVKLLTIITLLTLSCVLACLSVFLPITVHNRVELQQLKLGFPIGYIAQDQSWLPIGSPEGPSFPIRRALISPWENPIKIIWWRFFLNIATILIALSLIYFAAKILWQRLRSAPTHKDLSF